MLISGGCSVTVTEIFELFGYGTGFVGMFGISNYLVTISKAFFRNSNYLIMVSKWFLANRTI